MNFYSRMNFHYQVHQRIDSVEAKLDASVNSVKESFNVSVNSVEECLHKRVDILESQFGKQLQEIKVCASDFILFSQLH